MRTLSIGLVAFAAMTLCVLTAAAQPPEGRERRDGPPRGGPDGPGGPPRFELGRVLPPFAREELKLSKEQEEKIAALEKEVKERLAKVLTAEQKKQLDNLRPPQPGGPPAGEPGQPPEGRRPGRPGRGAEGDRPGRPPEGDRPARPAEGERPARPREGDRPARPAEGERPGRPGAEPADGPPRGPGGPGGRPRRFELGQVIPPFAREELKLTKEQTEEIAKLEKDVKERLSKILTAEQKKQMENLRPPGAGGRGGPGGRPEGGRPGRPPEGERPN